MQALESRPGKFLQALLKHLTCRTWTMMVMLLPLRVRSDAADTEKAPVQGLHVQREGAASNGPKKRFRGRTTPVRHMCHKRTRRNHGHPARHQDHTCWMES